MIVSASETEKLAGNYQDRCGSLEVNSHKNSGVKWQPDWCDLVYVLRRYVNGHLSFMIYFGNEWKRIVNITLRSSYSRENVCRYGLEAGSEYSD